MSELELSTRDRAMLAGRDGEASALCMRLIVRCAEVLSATQLIDVTSAHIDGCLYHGVASLDFVERLILGGGRVRIPTTLNVGSLDLIHPELFRGDVSIQKSAARLMQAHLSLGCEATFTCAPYQLHGRPTFGQQIAWAESNAIVFANSVLGARTNRYGDFIDLCAAITGRVPYAGLHVPANRKAQLVVDLPPVDGWGRDVWFALAGLVVGGLAGALVPVLTGVPTDATEDELKALGAASASTGAVAMFHAVGVTPEAPTLDAALGGSTGVRRISVSRDDLVAARSRLNRSIGDGRLAAVSLGTPHFSIDEFASLRELLESAGGSLQVPLYVNASRYTQWQLEEAGLLPALSAYDIRLVTDTCTYITPIIEKLDGVVMTNSGKMAHYAPSNMGVRLAFGSLSECVRSALRGEVTLDD